MSFTGVSSTGSNIQWQTADKTGGVDKTTTTGAGSIAGGTTAPGVDPMANNNAIMASLVGVMPKMSGDMVDVLVGTIMAKMKEVTDKSERTKINTDQLSKHDAIQNKSEKLKEAEKKIEEAADKMKHASIWDKIKLAFSYIAAILTMIAGAVLIATGAGTVAGACLIGAGMILLALAVDQTVETAMQDQGKGGLGMFGMMVKACYQGTHPGCSDDEANQAAQKGQMGIQIGLMGVAMLLSLPAMVPAAISMAESAASMVMNATETVMSLVRTGEQLGEAGLETSEMVSSGVETANAADQAGTTANEVASAGEDAGKIASDTAKTATKAGKIVERAQKASDIIAAGTQMADGAATAGSGAYHYAASVDSADAKKLQAESKLFQGVQEFLDDQIDAAIQRLKASGDRFNAVLDSLTDAVKDRGDTMAHAKFRA